MSDNKTLMKNIDAWVSALTGAGVEGYDNFASLNFNTVDLSQKQIEDLYTDNDIAATVVERIVHDALRSGYELDWQGSTDVERRDIRDWAESQYDITGHVKQARIYSRLYGGGAVYLGFGDRRTESMAIQGTPVDFLRPLSRVDLNAEAWNTNPLERDFGEVVLYKYSLPKFKNIDGTYEPIEDIFVHESRTIPFYGVLTTKKAQREEGGWGISVLHRVYSVLQKFEASFDATLHTLSEQSVPVYKVKALLDLLASENGELLAKRFDLINAAKSNYKAIILDQEEDYMRVEANLSESSNVVESAMTRTSGAAGIPTALLFGREPSGLNSTGDSDLENWNQQVASEQRLVLGPAIVKILRYLLAQPGSPTNGVVPDDLKLNWPAVETPSLQDRVNLYAQRAGADVAYIKEGVVTAAQVARTRAQGEAGEFPKVDLAWLDELEAIQKESLLNPPMMMAESEEPAPSEPSVEEGPRAEDHYDFAMDLLGKIVAAKDVEISYAEDQDQEPEG